MTRAGKSACKITPSKLRQNWTSQRSWWRPSTPVLFFFSSRRRHTRLVSDWSSDVCSSDLGREGWHAGGTSVRPRPTLRDHVLEPAYALATGAREDGHQGFQVSRSAPHRSNADAARDRQP